MNISENDLLMAFKKNNEIFLRKIHLYLNEAYRNLIYNQDEDQALNEMQICKLRYIENVWIENEMVDCMNRYDCSRPIHSIEDAADVLAGHPVFQHPLYSYLRQEASLEEVKFLIWNDSVLNLEFFDYLILAMVGVSEPVRLEIAKNVWDEAGRGCLQQFHTILFRRILARLGMHYDRYEVVNQMSWEGLAGINLFSYMSLYQHHKIKYFGVLAATEMLDPPHYLQLLTGFSRLRMSAAVNPAYYQEHAEIDIQHAGSWMNKIILPELSRCPEKISDFWLGFYLRLDSVQRYYDVLLKHFLTRKAA
ncbi:hypothetical protein AQUSIP_15830 [Aquicella siphonis]|uniref:Iron-containing redox enzyme family protein n=1 Tax=Aquicella siphonis TaxID=254247 RepID=A0A5E4PH89_9COXI|nr:iron-containing redox enzyme family protein [Aquicella siphonis]VVC76274.1 hypothetical protein AQUSIP_15830 [Aquicella siphonis]